MFSVLLCYHAPVLFNRLIFDLMDLLFNIYFLFLIPYLYGCDDSAVIRSEPSDLSDGSDLSSLMPFVFHYVFTILHLLFFYHLCIFFTQTLFSKISQNYFYFMLCVYLFSFIIYFFICALLYFLIFLFYLLHFFILFFCCFYLLSFLVCI